MTSWAASHQSVLDLDLAKLDIKAATGSKANPRPAAVEDDLLADLEPTIAKGRDLLELLEERVEGKGVEESARSVGSAHSGHEKTDFAKFAAAEATDGSDADAVAKALT